ncbi:hypothetical protein ASPVEDRAFT_651346 [Aspergillus versicolor CBS 583.65]|uniref:Uncharacterized protein n=1 Tax=Aspergillus versicolor CBS 583.65 TaxID=1036611 RepID=A0A1L9PJV5_ASPVE|nr:uncharacterized protein ASPVEDRAFT_651346 [Aspergillus versicolor CBS 583.65]OJJ01808.1 hypothetical protein ASPVEDRAFT_651346 [Aspergillus versicolor CBS 583.65]
MAIDNDNNLPNTTVTKEEVNLNGVARTLLVTLAARASDFRAPTPVLGDPYAQDILDRLDVDVDEIAPTPNQCAAIAVRTRHFDRWTSEFVQRNQKSTVLHLACGFDSRMQRVKWGENTRWIDIDLPEAIDLRRKVQPESLSGRDYSLLGVDVLDEDWMKNITTHEPVLVVMEGLLCYLPEEDVKRLVQRLCQTFPNGELLFECITMATLQSLQRQNPIEFINSSRAQFHWGVDDPKLLEGLHPGLKLVESVRLAEAPGVEKFPLGYRALMYLLSWIPGARDSARFLRFEFGEVNRSKQ